MVSWWLSLKSLRISHKTDFKWFVIYNNSWIQNFWMFSLNESFKRKSRATLTFVRKRLQHDTTRNVWIFDFFQFFNSFSTFLFLLFYFVFVLQNLHLTIISLNCNEEIEFAIFCCCCCLLYFKAMIHSCNRLKKPSLFLYFILKLEICCKLRWANVANKKALLVSYIFWMLLCTLHAIVINCQHYFL